MLECVFKVCIPVPEQLLNAGPHRTTCFTYAKIFLKNLSNTFMIQWDKSGPVFYKRLAEASNERNRSSADQSGRCIQVRYVIIINHNLLIRSHTVVCYA